MAPPHNPDNRRNKSTRATPATAQASGYSPADKFDVERTDSAIRVHDLQAQLQRSRKLNEYYDEAVAAIRASLDPASNESA